MPLSSDQKILAKIVKDMKRSEYDPITPLIDRYMIDRDRPDVIPLRIKEITLPMINPFRPGGRLSPSTVSGCERQAAFRFLGVQGHFKKNPDTELIFDDGDWHHHKWQYRFRDMASVYPHRIQVLGVEGKVRLRRLYIAGSLDLEIEIYDRKSDEWIRIVIDIKSINDRGYQWIYRSRSPKEEHVKQLITYMRQRKCRRGALLYDNKDNSQFYVFTVKFEKEMWKDVEAWCKRVLDQIEDQVVPPMHPECDHGKFLFDKCPYQRLCFGSMSEVKIRKMAYEKFSNLDDAWKKGLNDER